VRVNSFAQVSDSILFESVEVGRHARIRRAIIDKGVRIPEGFEIGYDLETDRKRGFTISNNGIVTVAKTEDLSFLESNLRGTGLRADLGRPNIGPPNSANGGTAHPKQSILKPLGNEPR
jgi:NDP-sugar pyrophosphorylase family protein